MGEDLSIDKKVKKMLLDQEGLILVETIVEDSGPRNDSAFEMVLKTTQYVVASASMTYDSAELQRLLDSLPDDDLFGKNVFEETDEFLQTGDLHYRKRVKNPIFEGKIEIVYEEVIVSLFPSVDIAKQVVAHEIPGSSWWHDEYLAPHEKLIPAHVPIAKELLK